MNNYTNNESTRYEIVLLEDDPHTLKLIVDKLEKRGIIVHAYKDGNKALIKIKNDPRIGALITDIEIRYPYPNGPRNGPQGYDVANIILKDSPNRFLSVVVLTGLEQEVALDRIPLFNMRVHTFSKIKWTKLSNEEEIEKTFDALALLVKEYVELTPNRWLNEVYQLYPKSRWVCEQRESNKIYPPYWEIYRRMWFSHEWKHIETEIGKKAEEIIKSYLLNKETRKLRGDHLSLTENPNDITFREHLIGRRVVYALKALEPAYWENIIRGEKTEEEKPSLEAEVWQAIQNEDTKKLVNTLNTHAAMYKLVDQHAKLEEINKNVEKLEQENKQTSPNYKRFLKERKELEDYLRNAKEPMKDVVTKLSRALEIEDEKVQQGFVPFLRFWNLDFSSVGWVKKTSSTSGGKDPLTQTLLLLGIRKQDIQDEDPRNWKLLLPEERKWLVEFLKNFEVAHPI